MALSFASYTASNDPTIGHHRKYPIMVGGLYDDIKAMAISIPQEMFFT